jgi:hypothetical protein
MDITEFFQQSSGKWFSQLTSHWLASKQTENSKSESGKSDIWIEMLAKDDPDVIQLCQQNDIKASLALCGVRMTWDGKMEGSEKKHKGLTVLVPIADPDQPNRGKLLRAVGDSKQTLAAGRYVLGDDEALTLTTESEALFCEDRLWFASPNLRFRTRILKRPDGFHEASFCSEIRLRVAPVSS